VDRTVEHLHTFLVEHYRPGVTAEECQSTADRVRASAEEMERAGSGIRFLHSTFVPEDEAAFCVFAAESSGLVEDAYRRVGVPFERIVDALELERDGGVPSGER
jgi:Nickel responsive protein SCO4226-like